MSDAAARVREDTETVDDSHGLRVPFSARASAPARPARRWLARAVFAKLALDFLFVCALAAYTHPVAFRADYGGSLDYADGRGARGWVVDNAHPGAAVEVQLYLDGRFAAAVAAERPRTTAAAATPPQGEGRAFDFSYEQLPPGEHEARVYAVRASRGGAHRTLQLLGSPLRFALK